MDIAITHLFLKRILKLRKLGSYNYTKISGFPKAAVSPERVSFLWAPPTPPPLGSPRLGKPKAISVRWAQLETGVLAGLNLALTLLAVPCDQYCLLLSQQPQAKLIITQTPDHQTTHSGWRVSSGRKTFLL